MGKIFSQGNTKYVLTGASLVKPVTGPMVTFRHCSEFASSCFSTTTITSFINHQLIVLQHKEST